MKDYPEDVDYMGLAKEHKIQQEIDEMMIANLAKSEKNLKECRTALKLITELPASIANNINQLK